MRRWINTYPGLIAVVLSVLAISLLAACHRENDPPIDPLPYVLTEKAGISGVEIDRETGCEYLTGYGRLTPRLDSAGRPICPETR